LADEEYPAFWENYRDDRLKEYDLIISCGDLNPKYLSFIVTMARAPLLYVHGNHDTGYDRVPPEGCDCIEDDIVVYKGVRILGLGGCVQYRPGQHQYTQKQMRKRIAKLWFKLWRHKGVDIVVTHAPPEGVGDAEDHAHRGFRAFLDFIDKYHPKYLLHGHVHLNYGQDRTRIREYNGTQVINATEYYVLELPDRE
jgi:Icc-related predicted phosphoesterase